MKVLLLGSGGREHALAWKIAQSPFLTQLFIAPGNAGTAECGVNVPLQPLQFDQIKDFCIAHAIDMVVVGPEEPLVNGIYDFFAGEKQLQHVSLIGPSQEGARLEGSKAFAKKFMHAYGIPTARYNEYTADTIEEGYSFIQSLSPPIVIKADGLAAGKGVIIASTHEEATRVLCDMLIHARFGKASRIVVVEEFLKGIEFSVFILTDGKSYKILPIAKDYKRVGVGDTGLNTGGMGAVTPLPFVNEALLRKVEERIIQPTLNGLIKERIIYKGFLYFGLMKVGEDPYVIEYNCRLGDPETQVVIPMLENDILELFIALTRQKLQQLPLHIKPGICATVVVASAGYPGAYEKGKIITGLDRLNQCLLFHAGTLRHNGQLLTNGGRVFAITALGSSLQEAISICKSNAELIHFEGKYFRSDIGFDMLAYPSTT